MGLISPIVQGAGAKFKALIQGASAVLTPSPQNFSPPKMTQNGISCRFESFLEGENF